jgi:cell wall-associated NlpC family hydrolase
LLLSRMYVKYIRRILPTVLSVALAASVGIPVFAATASQLKQEQQNTKNQLNSANSSVNSLEGQQEAVSEDLDAASASLAENIASVQLIENQIADTETKIEAKQKEYDAAEASRQEQYTAMKARIRYMYEKGDTGYVEILMQSSSFSDALNKAQYAEQLYEYDRKMLEKYETTVKEVAQAKSDLEDVKADQETSKDELQSEQDALQAKQNELQTKYSNYDALISKAQAQAATLQAKYEADTAAYNAQAEAEAKAAEEARKKAEAEAAAKAAAAKASSETGTASSSSGSTTATASANANKTYNPPGSLSGSSVVAYASQFVGNPYVYGGTSLTNGADCSGFTMSVYKAFGISLPRTAEAQREAGTAVASLDEAQPGDLICYAGHVALYCGNGTIVHASTARTGIKYGVATYRSIICIRRVIN